MYLENEETYEVEVGSPLELLQQVERQEGQKSVLRGLDEVVLKNKNNYFFLVELA